MYKQKTKRQREEKSLWGIRKRDLGTPGQSRTEGGRDSDRGWWGLVSTWNYKVIGSCQMDRQIRNSCRKEAWLFAWYIQVRGHWTGGCWKSDPELLAAPEGNGTDDTGWQWQNQSIPHVIEEAIATLDESKRDRLTVWTVVVVGKAWVTGGREGSETRGDSAGESSRQRSFLFRIIRTDEGIQICNWRRMIECCRS